MSKEIKTISRKDFNELWRRIGALERAVQELQKREFGHNKTRTIEEVEEDNERLLRKFSPPGRDI